MLQVWGGTWFLLNKIGLSRVERSEGEAKDRWIIRAWVWYLIGLPAWLIIFWQKDDWIVFVVEAVGAIPVAYIIWATKTGRQPPGFNWLMRLAVAVGIALSAIHAGGLVRLSQWLEVGSNVGFLVGTYLLARKRLSGYAWFVLMNTSMGVLMLMQGYPWLFIQQIASLYFVFDAYLQAKKKRATQRTSTANSA